MHVPAWVIRLSILLVLLGVAGFLSDALPHSSSEARTIGRGVKTFQELAGRFEDVARKKGGAYAFNLLLRADVPPNTDLHLLGHEIGNILYEQEGIEGITLCTQDFRNACSHAVVIGALNEFGTEALPRIREACTRAPGGSGAYTMCFHGLGHGVFAYYGYSFPETIAFCRSAGTAEYGYQEFSQCVGGAVMELMGGGGHDREAWFSARQVYLDARYPLRPCDMAVIPDDAKALCYIYLTPRLFELVGADLARPDPSLFQKAFSLCDEIVDTKLRRACYGGFGKEFIVLAGERDIRSVSSYTDEVFSSVFEWCERAERSEAGEACVGDAVASVFWGGENDPDAAFRFCSLAPPPLTETCYVRLSEDVVEYIKNDETKESLCARMPAEYRTACEKKI